MIRNYFKTALRSMWRSRANSIINVLGLGLGIACCVLIFLFVRDEWTFDTFHTKADRIYRAFQKEDWGENQQFFNTSTPFPLGPALKENFPEVEQEVRFLKFNTQIKVDKSAFSDFVAVGGEHFFDVFDFNIQSGSSDALHRLNGAVITRWTKARYFGQEEAVGKVLAIQIGENFEDFEVLAVVDNIPTNSSIHFGVLISDQNFPRMYNSRVLTSAWFDVNPETYILLKANADVSALQAKFPSLFKTLIGEDFEKSHYQIGLQPLTDIHLDTDYPVSLAPVSNPTYSYILAAISVLILFVACINFITLSLGRSFQRAREVGVRKVIGASRRQLMVQFSGEALLVTFMALAMGLGIAFLAMPLFNDLADKRLTIRFEPFTLLMAGGFVVIIGLIAGSYPAFALSGFRPITVLKGNVQTGGKQGVRKVLVGIQLALSIFLVSSTLLMRQQLTFLRDKDLGYNKEQLAVVPMHVPRVGRLADRVKAGFEKTDKLKAELARYPGVAMTCGASHDFANGGWTGIGYTDDKGVYRNFNLNVVDADYLPTLHMKLAAGRNFSKDVPSDAGHAILVNEAFVKELGWTDAIGKRIPGKQFNDHEIIGVVRDFNFNSLYTKVQPLVLAMDAALPLSGMENISVESSPVPKLFVRIRPGEIHPTIEQVRDAVAKIAGQETFEFTFVDQALASQYVADQNLGKIVTIATLLSILIGSSGLYGLASLAMQSRTREISIRKVMGATRESLLLLLSRDYLLMIAISLIASVPLTFSFVSKWLQAFEYKITIGAGAFLLSGAISLLIAVATIAHHTLKTASAQPAETLKYE